MFKFLLLITFFTYFHLANCQKTGVCPPFNDLTTCDINCFSDYHCGGSYKCCETACGGTSCEKPVRPERPRQEGKPGLCPSTPTGPWVCSSRCSADSHCRGTKKCCKNRCGAMACIKPEIESIEETSYNI